MLAGLKEYKHHIVKDLSMYDGGSNRPSYANLDDFSRLYGKPYFWVVERLKSKQFLTFYGAWDSRGSRSCRLPNVYSVLQGTVTVNLILRSVLDKLVCYLHLKGIKCENVEITRLSEVVIKLYGGPNKIKQNLDVKQIYNKSWYITIVGKVPTPDGSYNEADIRNELAHAENGVIEIKCPVGRIDILTYDHVIEVKEFYKWKEGLGQVLAYSTFYPDRHARLHLFGPGSKEQKRLVEEICNCCGVEVTYSLRTPNVELIRANMLK